MNIIILDCTSLYTIYYLIPTLVSNSVLVLNKLLLRIVPSFCKYDFFAHCMYLQTPQMLVGLDRGRGLKRRSNLHEG